MKRKSVMVLALTTCAAAQSVPPISPGFCTINRTNGYDVVPCDVLTISRPPHRDLTPLDIKAAEKLGGDAATTSKQQPQSPSVIPALVIAPPLVIPPPVPLPDVGEASAGSGQPPSVRHRAAVEQRNEQNAQVGQQLGSAIAGLIDSAIQRHKAANLKKPIPLPGTESDGFGHFSWGALGDCYLDPAVNKAFCTKDGKITYDQRGETEQQAEANAQALLQAPIARPTKSTNCQD